MLRDTRTILTVTLACVFASAFASPARAVNGVIPDRTDPTPPELSDIGVDEKLSTQLPFDLTFTDENGQEHALRDYFHKDKPVILQLSYFGCPMLCSLVSNGLVESLNDLSFTMGKEFEVINLSFDPNEGPQLARKKKISFLEAYNRPAGAESWHFLTGKPEAIRQITDATGFRYKYIERVGQFSHPAVLILLTPDGKVSRYLYGIKYDPKTLRLSLVEASQGKVGSSVDRFILTCFHYDASVGKYTPVAMGIMRAAGIGTVLLVGGLIGTLLIREARNKRDALSTGEAR